MLKKKNINEFRDNNFIFFRKFSDTVELILEQVSTFSKASLALADSPHLRTANFLSSTIWVLFIFITVL